jgi:hypothetical protein
VQEKYPSQSKVMLLSNFFLNAYNLKIRGQKKRRIICPCEENKFFFRVAELIFMVVRKL